MLLTRFFAVVKKILHNVVVRLDNAPEVKPSPNFSIKSVYFSFALSNPFLMPCPIASIISLSSDPAAIFSSSSFVQNHISVNTKPRT